MSQNPKQVWQKLSANQKKEILTELINICWRVINENINTKKTTDNTQSNRSSTV